MVSKKIMTLLWRLEYFSFWKQIPLQSGSVCTLDNQCSIPSNSWNFFVDCNSQSNKEGHPPFYPTGTCGLSAGQKAKYLPSSRVRSGKAWTPITPSYASQLAPLLMPASTPTSWYYILPTIPSRSLHSQYLIGVGQGEVCNIGKLGGRRQSTFIHTIHVNSVPQSLFNHRDYFMFVPNGATESFKKCFTNTPLLLLLPLTLQPTVGFGLSNNILPFFPTCHQLSPSSHSQHLKFTNTQGFQIFYLKAWDTFVGRC